MSPRILIIVALILAAGGFYIGTMAHKEAKQRAAAIVTSDTAGQDTTTAVLELKKYVANHMGARVNVTLQGSYDRAVAAAKASAAAQAANSQIYAAAAQACGGKRDSVAAAKCQQDYLSKNLASVPLSAPVPEPKLSDYQLKVSSPLWAPDLAGALWLGAVAAGVMAVLGLRRRRHA